MLLKYKFKTSLVKGIFSLSHKGKKRGSHIRQQTHEKDIHEMIFVDYGKIRLTLEKKTLIIDSGQCIIIQGGMIHSFEGVEEAPFDYMNIMFQGKIPDYIVGRILPVNRKSFELMSKLKEESNYEQLFGREVMASCLTEFIAYMARQAKGSVPGKMPDSANYKKYQSEFVNRALKVIADEYSKPLTMKMLSKSAGIGESRLRQLLKSEAGENFNTILHKQRILAAKHLINEGTYSLEEISTAVGYQYPSFFFRIFKRITGMTPGAYAGSLGEPNVKS